MKTVVALLLMIAMISPIGAASPASPIWTGSPGTAGESDNSFWRSPFYISWSFNKRQMNFLTMGSVRNKGPRFNIGNHFDGSAVSGEERKMIFAGLDKRINENWWVSLGYHGGRDQNSIMNIDAAYIIGSNAVVTFGYVFQNNYEMHNVIRTQLVITF